MQLHAVNEKKLTEKFVGMKRKSAKEKREKQHPVAPLRLSDDLGAGGR
jgi:hypothetical protein